MLHEVFIGSFEGFVITAFTLFLGSRVQGNLRFQSTRTGYRYGSGGLAQHVRAGTRLVNSESGPIRPIEQALAKPVGV